MLKFRVHYVLFNVYARLSAEVIEATPKQFRFVRKEQSQVVSQMFLLHSRYDWLIYDETMTGLW
jgi:hypothetical protein